MAADDQSDLGVLPEVLGLAGLKGVEHDFELVRDPKSDDGGLWGADADTDVCTARR